MTDKERLINLKNGTVFENDDIDFLLERTQLFFLLRDENTMIKQQNRELEKENKSMKEYIKNGIELGYIDDREDEYKEFI